MKQCAGYVNAHEFCRQEESFRLACLMQNGQLELIQGIQNTPGWFDYVRSIYPELGQGKAKTRMELINHSFRQWTEHKMAYDFETLAQLCSTAGLGNVRRREWTKGLDSEKSRFSLNADGSKCTTLYAETTKPTAGV
jgi:hypothetical protein